ncbi:miller-Dieker lissencephaly protein [Infundibulicybe gibba]|nr:miller-Dieker lissencephaly protein [Infundibulicybe gibba]
MATLTDRQQHDLHKSIYEYLQSVGYTKTCEQLRQEVSDLADLGDEGEGGTSGGLLVKKWTSVIRMQKKIMDLEARLAQALSDAASPAPHSGRGQAWLPTAPARSTLSGHRDKINAVRFHPTYSVLASASVDGTVIIWDWDAGARERTLRGHTRAVTDCDFSGSGAALATCSDDLLIKIWAVADEYKNTATLRGHEHSISSVRFLPGDAALVSASRDHTVRLWDTQTTHCTRVLRPHDAWIRCALPHPDARLLLTCADDHTARITDMHTAALKSEMRGHENRIECAAFVPALCTPAVRTLVALPQTRTDPSDPSFVLTGSRDMSIKLWDALRGTCLWTFVGHDGWVQALAFHPAGGHFLSVADDHTMRIWDLASGRCIRRIEAHSPFTQCVAWGRAPASAGGEPDRAVNVIATGGTDKLVKIWRP